MERIFTADPSHPAIIMAQSGATITHGELEARVNKIAHLMRAMGLNRGDHYAVFMENHPRYIECASAGERAGLYYTNVNSFLTPDELAYILNNSLSQVLFTSQSHLAVAREALRDCPRVKLCLVVDGQATATPSAISMKRRPRFRRRRFATSRRDGRCCIHQAQQASRKASCGRLPIRLRDK